MSTADVAQDTEQSEQRLLPLLQEYTAKLQALAENLPELPSERKNAKQRSAILLSAMKKLAQTVSQRLTFPDDYVLRLELELRLAEFEMALAEFNAA